jgi:hypothetical protein
MSNNSAQDPTQWVRVDVAYGESYTSAALNKKLAGILATGVYWGFEVVPATGKQVKIYPGEDPDYPKNVVVVERNGYSLTGTAEGEFLLPVPAGFNGYAVVEIQYDHQLTYSSVRLVETPLESHVVLAKLTVPTNAAVILPAYIDYGPRQEGSPALMTARMALQVITLEHHNLELAGRIASLEQWAETKGYVRPNTGG